MSALRYILVGDGLSPHLLKWARTLHEVAGCQLALGVVSSRGLLPEFDSLIPTNRRLLLHTQPNHSGGNVAVLRHLPRVGSWSVSYTHLLPTRSLGARTRRRAPSAGTSVTRRTSPTS